MNWSTYPLNSTKQRKALGSKECFDRLFTQPPASGRISSIQSQKKGDYTYILELVVLHEDQLEIKVEDGVLTVGTVKDLEPAEMEFVHKGIYLKRLQSSHSQMTLLYKVPR